SARLACERYRDRYPGSPKKGPVAQWIRRLTTDQKIPGSSPGWIIFLYYDI
ncbi:hypothetical protein BB558_007035, partial [Smittium angustum]